MNVLRLSSVLVALGLIVMVAPAASADHIDDVGDQVTVDYVHDGQEAISVCQRAAPAPLVAAQVPDLSFHGVGEVQDEVEQAAPAPPHVVQPLVHRSLCVGTWTFDYRVTVERDGEPVPFDWWVTDTETYGFCKWPDRAEGTVEFTISSKFCGPVDVNPIHSAPSTGQITVERVG